MNKIGLMESRLGKLERDNRRLKMAFGVMSLLFATVVFIGMAMPQQIPDVISAHEFHVVDADGAPRARMLIDRTSYFDEDGMLRATNGTLRLRMNSGGIVVADDNGTFRTRMNASGFVSYGEKGDVIWSTGQDDLTGRTRN